MADVVMVWPGPGTLNELALTGQNRTWSPGQCYGVDPQHAAALRVAGCVAKGESGKANNWRWVDATILDFGADPYGSKDSSAAIQAMNDALGYVVVPDGNYIVASTVNMTGSIKGAGVGRTKIVPGVTGGAAVLRWRGSLSRFQIADFSMEAAAGYTAFENGSGGAPSNSTAISIEANGSNYATRFSLRDLHIKGFNVGLNLNEGFVCNADNVHITWCATGFVGHRINSSDLNLRIEQCRKSFAVTQSHGVHFRQLLDESIVSNCVASTIDEVHGILFSAPYWESAGYGRSSPYLSVGATTQCIGVEILGAEIYAGTWITGGAAAVALDKVSKIRMSGRLGIHDTGIAVTTTAATVGFSNDLHIYDSNGP